MCVAPSGSRCFTATVTVTVTVTVPKFNQILLMLWATVMMPLSVLFFLIDAVQNPAAGGSDGMDILGLCLRGRPYSELYETASSLGLAALHDRDAARAASAVELRRARQARTLALARLWHVSLRYAQRYRRGPTGLWPLLQLLQELQLLLLVLLLVLLLRLFVDKCHFNPGA